MTQIKNTYAKYGFEFDKIIRVWCLWYISESQRKFNEWKKTLSGLYHLPPNQFELLSFRDEVFPALLKNIGTSNYSDEVMRTISLLREYQKQVK